jgi:predicted GNAT family acetyltransferase
MEFAREDNRIFKLGEDGGVIAEITFPEMREGVVAIDHTFVDDSLRGQGIASELVQAAYDAIKADGMKAELICPYAVKWFADRPDKTDIVTGA